MNFESFFSSLEQTRIIVDIQNQKEQRESFLLSNEALFQLPLISMIILIMAKDRRKPRISEIGQLVGESIEDSMPGFKGSSQHLGWSANLRIRTVKALNFLEHSGLVIIPNSKSRVCVTNLGKKVINSALSGESDLAYNLYQISKSYRNICVNKQLDLEIE